MMETAVFFSGSLVQVLNCSQCKGLLGPSEQLPVASSLPVPRASQSSLSWSPGVLFSLLPFPTSFSILNSATHSHCSQGCHWQSNLWAVRHFMWVADPREHLPQQCHKEPTSKKRNLLDCLPSAMLPAVIGMVKVPQDRHTTGRLHWAVYRRPHPLHLLNQVVSSRCPLWPPPCWPLLWSWTMHVSCSFAKSTILPPCFPFPFFLKGLCPFSTSFMQITLPHLCDEVIAVQLLTGFQFLLFVSHAATISTGL